MSEYVSFEIQAEIVKRVHHVRSLIRFRSVSKQWKSLIDSSEFITLHALNHRTDPHYLLVRYNVDSESKYVSIVDDDSFPQHKFFPVVSPTIKLLNNLCMIDCSHGLMSFYGYDACGKCMIVFWNPSIGKSVSLMLPRGLTTIGIGVCPKTSDPKIVKITPSSIDWKAEVFTLSSGAWRDISMNMPLSRSIVFSSRSQVVIDGVIYWATHDSPDQERWDLIMSFDLTSEEFGKLDLPNSLTRGNLSISKLKESLAVFDVDEFEMTCDVWVMMENGFVNLFSLGNTPYDGYELYDIIGFRRNGQPIRERPWGTHDGSLVTKLEAYEPSTNHRSDLGLYLPYDNDEPPYITITSYTESLLLLNHSNSII